MRIAAVLLGLSLLGCGGGGPDWHGDTTFTAAERLQVQAGVDWMTAAAGHEPDLIVWDAPHDVETTIPWTIVRWSGVAAGDYGRGRVRLGNVGFVGAYTLTSLAAHELGHHYGMRDVPSGVAMRHHGPELEWNAADQSECDARCR